ncbi:hypothetical protein Tco_0952773 [Tanacetum coccineum]|uniref:Uncharacterized protein n=1 Tax=Tanacetum coccineum TaxID=301880 RepID=A0ABQ5DZU7_9ASTR
MVVQNQSELGEGSTIPTDPHHPPTFIQPSTQPQKTQKPRKPKRKDTHVPEPSDPSENVTDEAIHKELGDSLVRAATTASSLEAEQDSSNINKTQSKATPNESSYLGTTSGGSPRCQETIRDTIAQTRVLDLEKRKTTQHNEIASLKRRVKKLGKKNRMHPKKGGSRQIEIKNTPVNVVEEVVKVINTTKLIVDDAQVSAAGNVVSTASAATTISAATATTDDVDDITLAQALTEMKSTKPKMKGVIIQELGESTTTISSQQSQDTGKGILIEPIKPMKKKDQIRHDEETALKLQAEFDKEERLVREKAKKEKEANMPDETMGL